MQDAESCIEGRYSSTRIPALYVAVYLDTSVVYMMLLLLLLLVPGLNRIPQGLSIYRLIWKDWYGRRGGKVKS
jgi:hypothetical protein